MRDLRRLKAAAEADLNRPTPIVRWTKRAKHIAHLISQIAAVVTAIGVLAAAVRQSFTRWKVPPAEMPKGNGIASTALDRVPEPPKQPPK